VSGRGRRKSRECFGLPLPATTSRRADTGIRCLRPGLSSYTHTHTHTHTHTELAARPVIIPQNGWSKKIRPAKWQSVTGEGYLFSLKEKQVGYLDKRS